MDTAITTRLSSITGTPPELAPTLRNWKRNDFLPMYARRLTATDVAAHYVRAATDEKPALRYITTTDYGDILGTKCVDTNGAGYAGFLRSMGETR